VVWWAEKKKEDDKEKKRGRTPQTHKQQDSIKTSSKDNT
jgi:hypothetical protein